MKKYSIYITAFLVLLTLKTFSQPLPIKYGRIDTAQLKMRIYEKDPTVSAVILCDLGIFDPNTFTFWRHLRVKIFKKEGSWLANQIIQTPTKSVIKGCTYNFRDGKVVETKLKDESIFRERVWKDYERFRVTMPDVADGSIIELFYSFRGLPMEWRFQDIIPVEWSELRIPASRNFLFNTIFYGFQPLYVKKPDVWIGRDMPALKEEPLLNSISNYLTRMEIELSEVTFPGLFLNFTTSWDDVNRNLLKDEYFGVQINDLGIYLNETVKRIKSICITPEQKIQAAFEYVKKNVKWNERSSLFTSGQLSETNKYKSGNSADVNLILLKLLKKLDIDVYPVALSTRENGIVSPSFPTIQKFNYVIVLAQVGDVRYLIDATEEELPFGLLPERCLNGRGRIIHEIKSDWIEISMSGKSKKTILATYQINGQHEVQGEINYALSDYDALNSRQEMKKYNSQEDYIAELESKNTGVYIRNFAVRNLDSLHLALNTTLTVVIENKMNVMGDVMNLNPMLFNRIKDSPLKNQERKYPVDFTYPFEERHFIKIKIPEGYVVNELPTPVNLVLPDKKATFKYNVFCDGSNIQLNTYLSVDEALFTENEYALLKQFYDMLIAKQAEVIILKKASL